MQTLRSRLQALAPVAPHGGVGFGDGRVDACLPPHGLARGAAHEIAAEGVEAQMGALVAGFAACWLARLADARPVLWIAPGAADLYPAGLLAYGFDPARLLLVRTEGDGGGRGTLAAAEAALRGGAVAAVVAEVGRVPKLAGRRLHLACLGHGGTLFLLRRFPHGRPVDRDMGEAAPVATRWWLAPAPSEPEMGQAGPPRWRVELRHARGGRPGAWLMEVFSGESADADRTAALPLRVVAGLADAAAAPARRLHAG